MANWYGSSRSNYFRVKDEAAFRAWCAKRSLEVWASTKNPGMFAIHPNDTEDGGWPSSELDEAQDEFVDVDIAEELVAHMAPNSIAVLQMIGAEKLRYLTGESIAVSAEGVLCIVSLDDIYRRARRRLPKHELTRAEY